MLTSGLKRDALDELERIQIEHGTLRPQDVVDAARPDASPLHPYFTWDDEKAGDQLRIMQARRVIATVRVTILSNPKKVVRVRSYHSLTSDRISGHGYRPLSSIMSDDQRRAELLATALRELLAFRKRYRDLSELAPVLEAIDVALEPAAATG